MADTGKQREQSQYNSKIKRDAVLGMIRDALSYDGSDDGVRYSFEALKKAGEYMKDGWVKASEELLAPLMGAGNGYMTREDRDYCWQELQLAWERIKERQNRIKENNYSKIHEKVYHISDLATYGDPHEALTEIKSVNQVMKGLRMEQHQYKSLRESLDSYWNKAITRINEKKQEGKYKRQKWESDMRDKVSRLSDTIGKIHNSIDRLESHREKLRSMRDSAYSSEYRDRVDGWIDEVDYKLRDARSSISDIENKISDIRSKLNS